MSYHEQVAKSRERFEQETAEHAMEVLRDDGLYRHLRFQKPGTYCYGFDLVTWPGVQPGPGHVTSRSWATAATTFEFFEGDHGINPHYWSEKLQAPRPDAALTYSPDAFRQRLGEWQEQASEDLSEAESAALREALDAQVLDDCGGRPHSEEEAHRLLHNFEHDGRRIDTWEWTFREYDYRFLWCCWAIVWGIGRYRAANREAVAA